MIMEEYNLSDKEAIDKLYKSNTFSKIEDPIPVYIIRVQYMSSTF